MQPTDGTGPAKTPNTDASRRIARLRAEYDRLSAKYDGRIARHFASYDNGTASRRRTTTFNANAAWTCERLRAIKDEIALLSAPTSSLETIPLMTRDPE